MTRKRTILIIENSTHITGALKAIAHSAGNLQSDFDFSFVLPVLNTGWRGQPWVRRIYFLPMLEISRRIYAILFYVPALLGNAIRLKRLLIKEQIDLIHNNDIYNLLPPVSRILGSRVPYICHIRFLPGKFPPALWNFWLRLHLKHAEAIVVVSDFLKHQLPQHAKIVRIYDGSEEGQIHPDKNWNVTSQNPRLLYLSNIIRGKGQEEALKAFAAISERFPEWRLRFTGGDAGLEKNREFKSDLMLLAEKLQVDHKIEWHEFTNDTEFEYKSCDVTLNFSESESFSMTCLDAQFAGCPVVATRSGGPAEIIEDGVTGFLVPVGDVSAMADAMSKLMENRNLRASFSAAAKTKSREKFGKANTSEKLKTLYDQVMRKL